MSKKGLGSSVNDYRRTILFNLKLIAFAYMVIVACNLILPVYINSKFGLYSLFQWIIIFIDTYALLVAFGIFDQSVPMLQMFFTRLFQIGLHSFILKSHIEWKFFGIILILDVIYIALMVMDRAGYEYEREEIE